MSQFPSLEKFLQECPEFLKKIGALVEDLAVMVAKILFASALISGIWVVKFGNYEKSALHTPPPAPSQTASPRTFSAMVTDPQGNPIPAVSLTLLDNAGTGSQTYETDEAGAIHVSLGDGAHEIRCRQADGSVIHIRITADKDAAVSIVLEHAPQKGPGSRLGISSPSSGKSTTGTPPRNTRTRTVAKER